MKRTANALFWAVSTVFLLVGCSSHVPATVSGNLINNPTLGYGGYQSSIPQGYVYVSEADTAVTKGDEAVQAARNFRASNSHPDEFIFDLVDTIPLVNTKAKRLIGFQSATVQIPGTMVTSDMSYARDVLIKEQLAWKPGSVGQWKEVNAAAARCYIFKGQAPWPNPATGNHGIAMAVLLGHLNEFIHIYGETVEVDPTGIHADVLKMAQATIIR